MPTEERESYPEVTIKCEDCGKEFSGKIGPLDTKADSYPLVKYFWPNPLLSALLNHHYTVRSFSGGHNSFNVLLKNERVGKAKISSSTQIFVKGALPK